MIQTNTVLSVLPLAKLFAEKGKTINAGQNTILSELVANTLSEVSYVTEVGSDVVDFESIAQTLSASTNSKEGEASLHDQSLESIVDSISNYVTGHVSFAKNVAKPVVVEMADGVNSFLRDFRRPDASADFTIQICERPEILSNEFFIDSLKPYEGKTSLLPSNPITCLPKLGEELLPLLLTGDADTDQEITAWFTRLGEIFFVDVWNNYFCKGAGVITRHLSFTNLQDFDSFEQIDILLAVYLFANKIFEQPEQLSEGSSLASYKNVVAETRDWAAPQLCSHIARTAAMLKNRTLVIGTDESKKKIRVFADVYRQWLEAGGVPEMMLGLLTSGLRLNSEITINERRTELLEAWNSYRIYHAAAEANKSFDYFKDALRVKFAEVCQHFSEEEMAFINSTSSYHENVKAYFEQELDKLKVDAIDNIFTTCLKLVCRARFYYTDAENILFDIYNITKDLPEANVREAALIAVINYVTDYVSDQLVLVDA